MKFTLLALMLITPCIAQVATRANEQYGSAEWRKGMAARLASSDRDPTQQPEAIVAAMQLKPGMTVADVGTGSGYMLPWLSAAVGPTGRVLAQDIFPDFLDAARKRAAERGLTNVEFIAGTDRDPRLPAGQADAVLVLDAYHHFDYPAEVLAGIRRALKPDGRLVVVDYHKSREAMGGRGEEHVRLSAADAIREIESNGFRLISRQEHKPAVQWIGIFGRAPAN